MQSNISPEDLPLVTIPDGSLSRKKTIRDNEPFCRVEIQSEDRFFYPNKTEYEDDARLLHRKENPFDDIHQPPAVDEHGWNRTHSVKKKEVISEDDLITASNSAAEESDFDWNADPDVKPIRRQTTLRKLKGFIDRPCCWHYLSPLVKRVFIAISGSVMFVGIAIIIYFTLPAATEEERARPGFKNIRSNVQCWMYWAAFMWHAVWITLIVSDLLPSLISHFTKKFTGRRSEKIKTYLEYYTQLKPYLCFTVVAAWGIGAWAFLTDHIFPSIKLHGYSSIMMKVFGCILIAAFLYLIQKIIVQMIAINFHRTAFKDRLAENKRCLEILDRLNRSETKKSRPNTMTPSARMKMRRSQPTGENKEEVYTNEKSLKSMFTSFHKKITDIVITDEPTNSVLVDKNKVDVNSDEYAKKVAKKLFYALASGHGDGEEEVKYLVISTFTPYFSNFEKSSAAFKVFDKDDNGSVSRREFRDTVLNIYRERKSLAQAIRDTSQAIGKIDATLMVVTSVITVFICLALFQIDFWPALIPIGTLILGCTFIFDTSAKALFQGILFQFVTHPYDAGDLVQIDGRYMKVNNIGILGTVFEAGDGVMLYAPTTVLVTKIISNIRRSGDMGENITFNIDFRTPNETIQALRERLEAWIQTQTRDFSAGFDLRFDGIQDMNQILINIWLAHKGNWFDLRKRFQRKTNFMMALKTILTELNIRYELPAQRFTSDRAPNPLEIKTQSF
ncbi:Mechanosensitive ion channel-domain-containing protein [Pilobolus umbonatus]|nr:Mechanosensitive ion channel-domain-containing protein [Pilobolus umbonatus]